jgi:hypothetical protein
MLLVGYSKLAGLQHCAFVRSNRSIYRNVATSAQPHADAQASDPPLYTPLHHDIEDFCKDIVPTKSERLLKLSVVDGCVPGVGLVYTHLCSMWRKPTGAALCSAPRLTAAPSHRVPTHQPTHHPT